MPRETISFIVPVRNDALHLRAALDSIRRCGFPAERTEVIVADNGSVDESVAVGRSQGAVVLEMPGLRVAEMRNRAARTATGDIVAFVDADNEIAAGWIAVAVGLLRDRAVGAVGQPYSAPVDGNWVQRGYDRLRACPPGQEDVEWLGSGNLALRREVFLEVGGFDPGLVTCEDVDLCQRIRRRGYRIVRDSRLASVHHGDPDTVLRLFLGELWRGRDNLRVSLRPPRSRRSLVSLALTCLVLAGLVLIAIAPLSPSPLPVLAGGACAVGAVIAMRAFRLALAPARLPSRDVHLVWRLPVVAAAYEIGRAMALVVRLPHRRRHTPASAPAHV